MRMMGAATAIAVVLGLLYLEAVAAFDASDYQDALSKSLLFYEGMRSGKLPFAQRIRWRANSGLLDGSAQNVNLMGGYYDSGDNVKFGFPMAFTITLLAWSTIECRDELNNAEELKNALRAIRWGTDYFIRAFKPPHTLWVQVGEPNSDHQCWERPEDMDTPRTAYQINPSRPGSDVAAETAAALAAASIVFQNVDAKYSLKMLSKAKQLFNFADRFRGSYSDVLGSVVNPFYTSYSGYRDELLWGASWLYKATNDRRYLQYILQHGPELGGPSISFSVLSWDNKYVGVDVLLAKVYKARADDFVCSAMPGRAFITPGGLFHHDGANNLQYVTSNAFVLLTYAKYLTQSGQSVSCGGNIMRPEQLRTFAKQQVDYILGNNPNHMSYMIGFGTKFPQRVHHRASSLPSIRTESVHISCSAGFNWLHTNTPNPNLLVGAVTGGPDGSDHYADDRDNYMQSEPSTYANSGLVGALAYLYESSS